MENYRGSTGKQRQRVTVPIANFCGPPDMVKVVPFPNMSSQPPTRLRLL